MALITADPATSGTFGTTPGVTCDVSDCIGMISPACMQQYNPFPAVGFPFCYNTPRAETRPRFDDCLCAKRQAQQAAGNLAVFQGFDDAEQNFEKN